MESRKCGPVWPSGVEQLGWLEWRGVKVRFHFCSPFSLEVEDEVRGCFLSCDFVPSQTLGHYDSAHRLPILMQNHSGGDSIALYSFPPPAVLLPFLDLNTRQYLAPLRRHLSVSTIVKQVVGTCKTWKHTHTHTHTHLSLIHI